MLHRLLIRNFATVAELELEFGPGLTALTGETGAGKSILFDALGLLLGARADSQQVRAGSSRCELEANFQLSVEATARQWLSAQDYLDEDEPDSLLLRRVLRADGGSKAWLNGRQITLASLRELGECLLDIHGQHAHQALLRPAEQRRIVDAFGKHDDSLAQVRQTFQDWQNCLQALAELESAALGDPAQRELLQYQREELANFAPEAGEYEALNTEFLRLNQVDELRADAERVIEGLGGDGGAEEMLAQALRNIEQLSQAQPKLANASLALQQALEATADARREVMAHADEFESDPERLSTVNQRLEQWENLARKHRCPKGELAAHWQQLEARLSRAENEDSERASLLEQQEKCLQHYQEAATALSRKRQQAAVGLSAAVLERLPELGLPHAQFQIQLERDPDKRSVQGQDSLSFVVSMNPGQPPQPMAQVASGGELARISLAIAVSCQARATVPVLLFDEVDVGVGGAIAEAIGEHLLTLAARDQVICVTHQPQVAALARQHLQVQKQVRDKQTFSTIHALTSEERVEELSRMAGGREISEQTRAHARVLLEKAHGGEGASAI